MVYRVRQGNKYGSTSHEYDGRVYHSKAEANYAQELDLLLKAGELLEVIPQYRIPLNVRGKHICDYLVDFKVIHSDGSEELIEVKGMVTEIWRLKWKLTEAIYLADHPGTKLTIVKV